MLKETAVAAVFALFVATVAATGATAGGAMGAADGRSGLAPATGRFLVAQRDLADPNFSQTVVLLTDYGEQGAMGLIVNWPTAAPAAALVPQLEGIADLDATVFVGGPVERQLMLMLVRAETEPPHAERVFDDVHLSTSRELLERVIAGEVATADLRLYSGYAGWAPGQLDFELEAGGWLVLPGEADLVFADDPDEVWPELIRRGEARWTGGRGAWSRGLAP